MFVSKKDGVFRPCVDCHALHRLTIKNFCPLLLIDDTSDQLKGARHFFKIDLRSWFHQVRLEDFSASRTVSRPRYRHFDFIVLAFVLTIFSATFVTLLNEFLKECIDKFEALYLDGTFVYSKSQR